MKKYRIRYTKGEQVRFISHLDMLKVFSRAAIRADLPVTYSEGFNPHPDFVFGMPLAVGVTSEAEYVDTSMTEDIDPAEVMRRFNEVMPEGITVNECFEIFADTPNIMKTVVSATYRVLVKFTDSDGCADQNVLFERIFMLFESKKALVTPKRSKKGMIDVDVRPMIFGIGKEKEEDGKLTVIIETAAGNAATLRPELALSALCDGCGLSCDIEKMHRITLGTEFEKRFTRKFTAENS